GNIRELRNFCDYLAATNSNGIITSTEVSSLLRQEPRDRNQVPTPAVADQIGLSPNPTFRSLEDEIRELEQRRMMEALAKAQGVQVRAAELLGMPIRTFSYKMKQYGISATGKSTK
ncbi:MAG TPA: helix-turn-helix domain-containing protein, partial [Pseudomonadota bacterium]|nr:helix-turn-helix domain-containing protein [Pseudomonadota bacterium]